MGKVRRTRLRCELQGSGVHLVHLTIGTPIKGQVPVLGFGGKGFWESTGGDDN